MKSQSKQTEAECEDGDSKDLSNNCVYRSFKKIIQKKIIWENQSLVRFRKLMKKLGIFYSCHLKHSELTYV